VANIGFQEPWVPIIAPMARKGRVLVDILGNTRVEKRHGRSVLLDISFMRRKMGGYPNGIADWKFGDVLMRRWT
ncbi:MAG TPA: hypothetical protein VE177_05170, partial [Candidatus Binatus sp.]|nr:hypothetical protein [Candidatus Binatus sp.]